MAALGALPLIKALVPDAIFKRGKEIVASNKLSNISFQGPALEQAIATCAGSSEGDNYSLSISINAASPSKPTCQCSCPAAAQAKGGLCKHLVALLLIRLKKMNENSQLQTESGVSAEPRSNEEEIEKTPLVDSQLTEPFIESQEVLLPVDSIPAFAPLVQTMEDNKRVLPSWMLGVAHADAKVIAQREGKQGKSVASRKGKRRASGEDMNKSSDGVKEGNNEVASGGASSHASKKGQRQKYSDIQDENEHNGIDTSRNPSSCRMKRMKGRPRNLKDEELEDDSEGRRSSKRDATSKNKWPSKVCPKRKKSLLQVESDLSENEPEVNDEGQAAICELDLTTEDLVSMARTHLEAANSSGQPDEDEHKEQKTTVEKRTDGKEASIFSVHGWKEIAGTFLSDKNDMISQQIMCNKDLRRVYSSNVGRTYGDAQDGNTAILRPSLYESSLGIDGKRNGEAFPESADTVAEDMLGIFLGPSLSIAANCGKGESQAFPEDMAHVLDPADIEQEHHCPELPLTVTVDRAAKPRKKSSLKDKVAMFFG